MKRKYYVTACKEVEVNGKWYIKTTSFVIEAENCADAKKKTRSKGYMPISVQRFN